MTDDVHEEVGPQVPLLFDPVLSQFDIVDDRNLTTNTEGKGPYLQDLSEQGMALSHRLCDPFPLESRLTANCLYPDGGGESVTPGVTLPLMMGDIPRDRWHDPVYHAVHKYWQIQTSALNHGGVPSFRKVTQNALIRARNPEAHSLRGCVSRMAVKMTEFLLRNPIFKGWDSKHNWLYGGGCLAVLDDMNCVVRPYGHSIVVSRLPVSVGDESQLSESRAVAGDASKHSSTQEFRTESFDFYDEQIINDLPTGNILQIYSASQQSARCFAVRSMHGARLYHACADPQQDTEPPRFDVFDRMTSLGDGMTSHFGQGSGVLTAVHCGGVDSTRWGCVRSDGRLLFRDAGVSKEEYSTQLPAGGREHAWYGICETQHPDVYHLASWSSIFTVDVRVATPSVMFSTFDCPHAFISSDRLHALTHSATCSSSNVTLFTSNRHLNALDDRRPSLPTLRSRLSVPQPPLMLRTAPWRRGRELVVVGSTADRHLQCLAFDWREPRCEIGVSRLLECPLEALQSTGVGTETERRSRLTTVGLACRRTDKLSLQVLTANWCGDVFEHTLRRRVGGDPTAASRSATDAIYIRRRLQCWSAELDRQRWRHCYSNPLKCHNRAAWPRPLSSLLRPVDPDETSSRQPVQLIRRVARRTSSRSEADSGLVEEMLSEWETTDTGHSTDGGVSEMSVDEELEASRHKIFGSVRRAKQRRLSERRRKRPGSSAATSDVTMSPGDDTDATVDDPQPAPRRSVPCRQQQPAASPRTPAAQLLTRPPVTPLSSYTQFSMDLFDD